MWLRAEDVDQLIKFIEGKYDASKSVAAVEVVGSPKPLQDAESSKSKKKKNRKKKSASTTDARPGDAIPLGSSVSAIAASIAGVHTVELDALFDESKFEEDSELVSCSLFNSRFILLESCTRTAGSRSRGVSAKAHAGVMFALREKWKCSSRK